MLKPHHILASGACFSVGVAQGTKQEVLMWSWVRLMHGKLNMCWDDGEDEEWCLCRRWRVTGWKQHSGAGDIHMNTPTKYLRLHWPRCCYCITVLGTFWRKFAVIFDHRSHMHITAMVQLKVLVWYLSKPWLASSAPNKSHVGFICYGPPGPIYDCHHHHFT